VAQANILLFGKMVESFVVEFDQEKFEEFLSSGSASLKAMRQYHTASSKTRSRISLEITPGVAHPIACSAKGAASEEILKTSRAAHATRVNVFQETLGTKAMSHGQRDSEDQFCRPSVQTLQFQVDGGS